MAAKGWAWNAKAGRYYNTATGRFLTNVKALEYVQASADAAIVATDLLAEQVAEGAISPGSWKTLMRREIKHEYIRQYELGIGGRGRILAQDWGSIGGMVGDQYKYLDGFAADLPGLSEGQIRARAQMYINSGREAYERAHGRVADGLGFDEVLWVENPAAEHCPDCDVFAEMGWQKVEDDPYMGAIPGSGATVCLTNCKCGLDYRDSQTGEQLERTDNDWLTEMLIQSDKDGTPLRDILEVAVAAGKVVVATGKAGPMSFDEMVQKAERVQDDWLRGGSEQC